MKRLIMLMLSTYSAVSISGTWCTMDEVLTVDTSGNSGTSCWVSGKLNVNGVLKEVTDLNICSNTNESANARNLSVALTAFTANKKLSFWFDSYSTCDQVKLRWEATATRVTVKN